MDIPTSGGGQSLCFHKQIQKQNMNLLITLFIFYPFQVQCIDIFEQVRKDSMDGIKKAIAENEDVINIPGPGGQTPLMHAVLQGKIKAVKYLLHRKGTVLG